MPDSTLGTELTPALLERHLPGFRVLRQVGHGAMGVVFEANQVGMGGRRVAIKVLPPHLALRERTVKRFVREAQQMARIEHPNVVQVYDTAQVRDLPCFYMRFVEGPPLDKVLRVGPLAIADVVQIGIQVADALRVAHAKGVMHRDVKPSNLLRDGERVVLTDFGLARPLDSDDAGTMTESGDLVGTPLYMAPEQISGEQVDGRADVWGLGVTLYELLTQRAPFTGPNAQGILHAILHKDPPLLRKQRDDVPPELEAVVLKCLEKDPARRYSGAAALVQDLEAVRDGRPVSAAPPRFFDPAVRWIRRHPWEAGAIALCLLLAGVAWLSQQQSRKLLDTTQAELTGAEQQTLDERARKELAQRQRAAADARFVLSEARIQWAEARAQGDAEAQREAEGRVIDLLESLDIEQHADIIAEGMTVISGWLHQQPGGDAMVLGFVEQRAAREAPRNALLLRAAALTGLERLTAALDVHRQRSRLDPGDPAPVLDAARISRRMALESRAGQDEAGFQRAMSQALGLLQPALGLAVQRQDSAMAATLLIERARCLLDLGLAQVALDHVDRALAEDPHRVDGQALRGACRRRLLEQQQAEAEALLDPSALSGDPSLDVLSLQRLLPGRRDELDTGELETAGRGLKSIYRGLHNLLRDAAQPGAENAAEPSGAATGG